MPTPTVNGWNSTCSAGESIQTQAKWASTALNMYPGYTGPRPKMLIIHGSADTTIYPQNFNETLKQWAGVLGYTYGSPQQTLAGNPSSEYTKYVYGPDLVGVYGTGITHNVPINGAQDLEWLGITGADAPSSSSSSAIVVPTTTPLATVIRTTTSAACCDYHGGCWWMHRCPLGAVWWHWLCRVHDLREPVYMQGFQPRVTRNVCKCLVGGASCI